MCVCVMLEVNEHHLYYDLWVCLRCHSPPLLPSSRPVRAKHGSTNRPTSSQSVSRALLLTRLHMRAHICTLTCSSVCLCVCLVQYMTVIAACNHTLLLTNTIQRTCKIICQFIRYNRFKLMQSNLVLTLPVMHDYMIILHDEDRRNNRRTFLFNAVYFSSSEIIK